LRVPVGLTAKDGVGDVGISGDLAWHAGTSWVIDGAGTRTGQVAAA
jgi:hypothetical protein